MFLNNMPWTVSSMHKCVNYSRIRNKFYQFNARCGAAQAWPKSVSVSVTASSDVAFLDVKWLKIVLCVSAKGCLTNGITSKIPWYPYQQEILLVLFAMESMKVVMQQFYLNKYQPIYFNKFMLGCTSENLTKIEIYTTTT